jgi:hypothetical protein
MSRGRLSPGIDRESGGTQPIRRPRLIGEDKERAVSLGAKRIVHTFGTQPQYSHLPV